MEENYQNAYKYLIEPLRSSGVGGGGRTAQEALRCAPAPAASHTTHMEDGDNAARSSTCFVIACVCVCMQQSIRLQ